MKNLFFFLLPLLVFACKSVEKHREPIMKLSSDWDATTKDITDFQAMVSADLTTYTKSLAAVQPDDATRAKMTPQQVTVWEASQKTVTDALGSYAPLQKTINDFVATWTEKSAEVTALKDGLEKGKLDGDVDAKIAELNAMNATARENLNAWKASYATVKGSVDASMASLQQGAMPPM
ncbi:MAG TPA: hypothetical protein VMZ69_08520 [Saprospiraceae bacterium]|nr:hypothetical protein [Saprospiraceae bacterium]